MFVELSYYALASSGLTLTLFALKQLLVRCRGPKEWINFVNLSGVAAAWFCTSVSFTIFNKFFMQLWRGGFHYPILTTTVHMFLKVLVSRVWLSRNRDQFPNRELPLASWGTFLTVIAPIGVLTALDVMLSNLGILYAPLSIYTAIKGSVPVFIFLFGVVLGNEIFSIPVLLALSGIAAGLAVAVVSSTSASLVGVLLCVSASACGGLRWTLSEHLLRSESPSSSHSGSAIMVALYRFAPVSAAAILPIGLWFEGPAFLAEEATGRWTSSLLWQVGGITLCGGAISFVLIALELSLVSLSSSLALGVLGTIKEMLQIALSLVIFQERMSAQTGSGLAFAVASGVVYRWVKAVQKQEAELGKIVTDETDALLVELDTVFSSVHSRDDEEEESSREGPAAVPAASKGSPG